MTLQEKQESIRKQLQNSDRTPYVSKKRVVKVPKSKSKPNQLKLVDNNEQETVNEFKKIDLRNIGIKQIRNYLQIHNGNISKAAQDLNVNYSALYLKVKKSAELQTFIEQLRNEIVDLAENVLIEKLRNGDSKVAMFVAETMGKNRGYVKKEISEVSGKNGKPIEVKNIEEKLNVANKMIENTLKDII